MIDWHDLAAFAAALCLMLALAGGVAARRFGRRATLDDYTLPTLSGIAGAVMLLLTLAACTTPPEPGIEVRPVEVVRETQRPCPGHRPVRPQGLGPLAPNMENALAQALAKLAEYSGPGKYADQAEAYFEACPPGG